MNASVEFDVDTLSPTYKLLMGVPGRSNAFDISKKLGLSLNIINKAKTMIGTDEKEINEMIESLERNYKRVETQRLELDRLVKKRSKCMMIYLSSINNSKIMKNL